MSCLAAFLLLTGCAGENPVAHADALATAAGFHRLVIRTASFQLLAYVKGSGPVARVYIEGDGHAWSDRNTPSDNPTPWNPVALELAASDPATTVAWLARPCQYLVIDNNSDCASIWWTNWRYHDTVITSMSQALDRLRVVLQADRIELVGFSGGGAVAALLAARRTDIVSLRTVAANLDITLWTSLQHVSPLDGSLNPADFASRLAHLPQRHFAGGADDVVEPAVIESFLARLPDRRCASTTLIPGLGHSGDWQEIWPDLLRINIGCKVSATNFPPRL